MESMDELRCRLNVETGRLTWAELARPFARGAVIRVAAGGDLVEVAACMAMDDQAAIAAWAATGAVARASDADALAWNETRAEFWAVVVAPWVLVQEIRSRH